jgi:hypothetical protein
MYQSLSWQAYSRTALQEILRLVWNKKFHCRVHKTRTLDPITSQINLVHTLIQYSPNVHFYSILPSTPSSAMWSLPFRFSDKAFLLFFISPKRRNYLRDGEVCSKSPLYFRGPSVLLCYCLCSLPTVQILRNAIVCMQWTDAVQQMTFLTPRPWRDNCLLQNCAWSILQHNEHITGHILSCGNA